MTTEEKIALLEECMDVEEGTLSPDDVLADYEEWDSLTALGLIAVVDEKLHITLTGKQLKEVTTVNDVLALLER